MRKYKVANCKIKLDIEIWDKFKISNTDIENISIQIYGHHLNKSIYGMYYIDLLSINSYLIMNDNDIMVVNEDWSKANIIKMEHPESFDAFTMQLFYTHAVRNHMIQVHSSLIELKIMELCF